MHGQANCPFCSKPFRIQAPSTGSTIRCPHCQGALSIRSAPQEKNPAPAATEPPQPDAPQKSPMPRRAPRLMVCGGIVLIWGAITSVGLILGVRSTNSPSAAQTRKETAPSELAPTPQVDVRTLVSLMKSLASAPTLQKIPRSAPKLTAKPSVLFRAHSIQTFLGDYQLAAPLLDRLGGSKLIDGMFTPAQKEKFISEIAGFRPLGGYLCLDPQKGANEIAVMVPVRDPASFKALLEDALTIRETTGGFYRIEQRAFPGELHFRFENGYACFLMNNAQSPQIFESITPEVLEMSKPTRRMALSVNLEKISELLEVQKTIDPPAGEQNRAGFKLGLQLVKKFFREGQELTIALDALGRADAPRLVMEAEFKARPETDLAEGIQYWGQARSLFGGLLSEQASLQALVHYKPPAMVRKHFTVPWNEFIEEQFRGEEIDSSRAETLKFIEAIKPTVQEGELDVGMAMSLNEGQPSSLFLLKIKEPNRLEKLLRESGAENFQWDVHQADNVRVHRLTFGDFVPQGAPVLGLQAYFAFRDDAILWTQGEGALELIKKAIQTPPKVAPILLLDLNLKELNSGPFGVVFPANPPNGLPPREANGAQVRAFRPDRIRVRLEGGTSLRFRLQIDAAPPPAQ